MPSNRLPDIFSDPMPVTFRLILPEHHWPVMVELLSWGDRVKRGLQFETSLTVRSPGLEFNDIGYMRYSDVIHHGSWAAYYIRNPFSIFNNFYLNTNYWMYWNFFRKAFINLCEHQFFILSLRIDGKSMATLPGLAKNTSTNLLRGGPSFIQPGGEEMNLNISTDQSKKFSFNIGSYQGVGDVKKLPESGILDGF